MVMGKKSVRELVTVLHLLMLTWIFLLDPSDSVLKESLKQYAQERLSRDQKLARLGIEHGLYIGYNSPPLFCHKCSH